MADEETIPITDRGAPNRIRNVVREIVLQVTIGNKHRVSVQSIEDDTEERVRELVADLATILARDSAIRWEQRAEQSKLDFLALAKDHTELQKYVIELQQKVIEMMEKIGDGENVRAVVGWCEPCQSYHAPRAPGCKAISG